MFKYNLYIEEKIQFTQKKSIHQQPQMYLRRRLSILFVHKESAILKDIKSMPIGYSTNHLI